MILDTARKENYSHQAKVGSGMQLTKEQLLGIKSRGKGILD